MTGTTCVLLECDSHVFDAQGSASVASTSPPVAETTEGPWRNMAGAIAKR